MSLQPTHTPDATAPATRLWTPAFVIVSLQFLLVTSVLALFFPFQAYLIHLGFDAQTAGLLLGADAFSALLVQPLVALRVHPGNAGRWLAGGAACLATALGALSISTSFVPLLLGRLLQGLGFGCLMSALIARMVAHIPPERSGQAFGWVSLVRLLPYAAVPALLDAVQPGADGFGRVLQIGVVLALLPWVLGIFQKSGPLVSHSATTAAPGMATARSSLRQPAVMRLLLASLALYSGYAAVFFYLRELGAHLGVADSGRFFSLASLVMMGVRLAAGAQFDRWNKTHLSVAGLALVGLSYALLPWATQPALFFALAISVGLGWGVVMPLQSALMFEASNPASQGLNQNLLLTTMQAGFTLGPVAAGVLLAQISFVGLFLAAAVTTFAAAALTLAPKTGR